MQTILAELFSLQTILALVVGTFGGLVIGALPGLSATMGMSLLIPITYSMDTVPSMVMLAAIYCSAVYGGSFSAILIHTPGTPASAATAIDGYELTKQGKGLQALGVSTTASVIGGVLSVLALLLIAPQLVKVALMFSSPEYFLIAIFGLTIVGGLSGKNLLKGLVSAGFGLIVGMVGMNIFPYARYSFGNLNLSGGIQLVPAMIGLFSLSQVLTLSESRPRGKDRETHKQQLDSVKAQIAEVSKMKGRFWPTWKMLKQLLPAILRASILGIGVGILPGAGGDIGSWVGYNSAKNASKEKALFGKGSLEGIAGSEAGNNAVCGGALIPALTLGIPGSGAAAVFLGALTVQGFSSGTNLFGKYADMTYSILLGFLAANLLMGIFGWLLSRYAVRFAALPNGILIPVITALSVIGSYAIRNNIFDVYVMLFFGIVGYLMKKFDFPAAPTVLALILGPMAERSMLTSIQMCKGNILVYYFTRPICVFFVILILFTFLSPLLQKRNRTKKERQAEQSV